MKSGGLLAAERGRRVVRHAGLVCWGMAYLSDLFIRGDSQSERLGRRLLHEILPGGDTLLYTMASTDYRAVALYARSGMQPRWPHYVLAARPEELRDIASGDVETVTAAVDDPALGAWDDALSGRPRPAGVLGTRGASGRAMVSPWRRDGRVRICSPPRLLLCPRASGRRRADWRARRGRRGGVRPGGCRLGR